MEISATGGDTNIDLKITPKGSGQVVLDGKLSQVYRFKKLRNSILR